MGRFDEDQRTVVHERPVAPSAVPRQRKLPFLEQVEGPGAPRTFQLELAEVIIGRSLQAAISIESTGMSRQHASIKKNGADFSITDLDSANGLYVNGIKAHSAVLHEGDQLQLGDVVFVFHEGV